MDFVYERGESLVVVCCGGVVCVEMFGEGDLMTVEFY